MEILDWVIRNQTIIFAGFVAIFFFVGLSYIARFELLHVDGSLFLRRYPRLLRAVNVLSIRVRMFIAVAVSGVVAIMMAAGFFAMGAKPIPSTLNLDFPELQGAKKTSKGLIVFIHGWNGDPEDTWEKFPELVKEDGRLHGYSVLSIGYPTYMVRRNLTISQLADWLDSKIRMESKKAGTDALSIVAHSMGGLVARELALLRALDSSIMQPISLIEIATPHLGADVATLAKTLGISKRLTSAVAPRSPFIVDLRLRWNRFKRRPRTACFSSPHDLVVPEESALAQCDKIKSFPMWGHSAIVKPEDINDDRYYLPIMEVYGAFNIPSPDG